MTDLVNHPPHYESRVPGIEMSDVAKYFPYLRGTAIKYLWRAGSKEDTVQDLQKAVWYIQKELEGLGVPRAQEKGPAQSGFVSQIDITGHPDFEVMRVHKEAAEQRLEAVMGAVEDLVRALAGDIEV